MIRVKRIKIYLITLWFFYCISFVSIDIYADSGENSVDISLSTAQGAEEFLLQEGNLAEFRAFVDKSTITIGEKVTYNLEIDIDSNLKVEFPTGFSELGGFVVKDFGKNDKKIGRNRIRKTQWYLLNTYTAGSYVIPAQSIKIESNNGQTRVLKTPEIFVQVKSVLDNEEESMELRDIKEPLSVNPGISTGLVLAFIIIGLIVGGIILWKSYLKKNITEKITPLLSPERIAFGELKRIESLGLIEKEMVKEYYYLVSLTLRTYLENRFFLKAPEQTTEEFLESVVSSDNLEGKHISLLKEYLNHCDLVKYAKFDPGKSRSKKLIETTRQFIKETAEDKEDNNNKNIRERKNNVC